MVRAVAGTIIRADPIRSHSIAHLIRLAVVRSRVALSLARSLPLVDVDVVAVTVSFHLAGTRQVCIRQVVEPARIDQRGGRQQLSPPVASLPRLTNEVRRWRRSLAYRRILIELATPRPLTTTSAKYLSHLAGIANAGGRMSHKWFVAGNPTGGRSSRWRRLTCVYDLGWHFCAAHTKSRQTD